MDLFVGGASGQASAYICKANGFSKSSSATFAQDKDHEDMHATFFDIDGDQDLDLYVVSGSGVLSRN